MNEQPLKTSGADVLSSRKILRKTSEGVATTTPLVHPKVNQLAWVTLVQA